jgi:hypothetical protein
MIISSILDREILNINTTIKALWTPSDDGFEKFIINNINCELLAFDQLYYGNNIPNLIICNDKIQYYDTCHSISRKLHLPVLLIDHKIKNPLYDSNKIKHLNHFPCMHHIAISKTINDSWELKAQVLSYNNNDKENINIWKNLMFQITKKMFKL